MSRTLILCTIVIGLMSFSTAQTDLGAGISNELSSIDFASIIGGPLSAVVQAQAQAAQTTVDFIMQIGFDNITNESPDTRMVSFSYTGTDADGNARQGEMKVPFLTVVPIPYLRFETADVEFNVQITSTTSTSSTSFSSDASTSSSFSSKSSSSSSWWSGSRSSSYSNSHSSRASYSSQKTTNKSSVKRNYSLRVLVHAQQAEVPEGMAKILDKMLEIAQATLTDTSSSSSDSGR